MPVYRARHINEQQFFMVFNFNTKRQTTPSKTVTTHPKRRPTPYLFCLSIQKLKKFILAPTARRLKLETRKIPKI